MIKCSIIFNVLKSYEVIKRQVLLYERILPDNFEVIFVDNGSKPEIKIPKGLKKKLVLCIQKIIDLGHNLLPETLDLHVLKENILYSVI